MHLIRSSLSFYDKYRKLSSVGKNQILMMEPFAFLRSPNAYTQKLSLLRFLPGVMDLGYPR